MNGEKRNKSFIKWGLLGLILLLGLWVRVYRLSEVPAGFFADEASRGVEAYSLLMTGKDSYGESWPLFFKAVGAPIPPLQFYSVIPFVWLLGLNEIAVRLASVFWGMVGVVGVYFLGKEIDKLVVNDKKRKSKKFFISNIGLWGALVLAIEPWAIHYSRIGWEAVVYMSLYVWGWWAWLKVKKNSKWWIGFGLIWGLVLYSYNGAYISVPLTVGLLVLFSVYSCVKRGKWKMLAIGLGFFVVMGIPVMNHLLFGEGLNRWNQVTTGAPSDFSKRVVKFGEQYLHQLSFGFFFGKGENTFITRHFTQGLLPLLKIQLPFIVMGLVWAVWRIRKMWWIFVWLAVYPVVGALANGGPFTSRSIIGAPLMALLTGLGIWWLVEMISNKNRKMKVMMNLVIVLGMLISFGGFWQFYMNEYPMKSADFWGWQYGPKEIVGYFKGMENQYDELIMSGEFNAPYIFLKFYAPDDCRKCRIGDAKAFDLKKKQLFALSLKQINDAKKMGYIMKMQKLIKYPNGEVAFVVGTLNKKVRSDYSEF